MIWKKNMAAKGNLRFLELSVTLKYFSSKATRSLLVGTNDVCEIFHRNYAFYINLGENMAGPISNQLKLKKII